MLFCLTFKTTDCERCKFITVLYLWICNFNLFKIAVLLIVVQVCLSGYLVKSEEGMIVSITNVVTRLSSYIDV